MPNGSYFMDDQAASEPAVGGTPGNRGVLKMNGYEHNDAFGRKAKALHSGAMSHAVERRIPRSWWPIDDPNGLLSWMAKKAPKLLERWLKRCDPQSVLTLASEALKEKHFAAYPTALVRKCLEMATSKAGCCPACGSPWAPVVESERVATRPGKATKINKGGIGDEILPDRLDPNIIGNRDPQRHVAVTRVAGYRATCSCSPVASVPCRVLDPFMGSGTTGQVANHLGLDWAGIEASAEYIEIAERRVKIPLRDKTVKTKRVPRMAEQRELLFNFAEPA